MSYGFGGRLSEAFPSQVIIDTTEICNLACIHCPHPAFKKSDLYGGRRLDPDLCRKAIDEIATSGEGSTQHVRFTGEGEPFTHPAIFEMLEYAVLHSGAAVSLTTNGSLLNPARIDRLLATGVHVVDVSIDAFNPATYAAIRINGDLEVTRANVLMLLDKARQARAPVKVVVSYVEQPLNAGETDDFERFWKDRGAEYVVIRRLHSNAGACADIAQALHSAGSRARRPCLYPWERISLSPRGELLFCPQDWVRGSFVADYRQTTIREVWHGDFYGRLRGAHLTNDFSCHSFCGQCPDWQQTRWPEEGRSYADMIQDFTDRG